MKFTEQKNRTSLSSLCRGWLKSPIAHLLMLALIVPSLPAPAQAKSQATPKPDTWQDLHCQLPGADCNHTMLYTTIGVGAAGAALITILVVHSKHHKGNTKVQLNTKPVKFSDFVPGQPAKLSVPLKNEMNAAITVKELTVEDPSGALTLGDARQGTFTLAPGEGYDIPVIINTNNAKGKARLRIVATSEKAKKDVVQFIDVSYGHGKSKHHKLIP